MKLEYWVTVGGVQQGPYGVAELRRRFEQGEFPAGCSYWRHGWAEGRRFDEPSVDALLEMLLQDEIGTPAMGGVVARDSWRTAAVVAVLVLVASVTAFWIVQRIARAEEQRERMLQHTLRESEEAVRMVQQRSEAELADFRQQIDAHLARVRRERVSQSMDEDARFLAGAAQQYFLESATTMVAITYDPRTGALGGPVSTNLRRISPGYTVVPAQLGLEGIFQLEHPEAGVPRRYFEDGRPAPSARQ